jgi:ribosome-associated toxin RatA of RatAB toxin-antitoxin module
VNTVEKSVLIWYSPREMYDLVVDVRHYPQFLPWCNQAEVLTEDTHGMTARLGLGYAGLNQSFTTRNRHEPGRSVALDLVDGPFSSLSGRWRFAAIGGDATPPPRACRISLVLKYEFSSAALATLVGPVFDGIANSLVDAFVKRAEVVYGDAG